jgi:four helix bundle protein
VAGVARFEDLIAWQRARLLARMVYAATRLEPFARDRALAWQIQRAAVSIMANLAEGFERGRATEFHQFASTAKASCAEVRSHLYLAFDNGYLNEVEFNRLMYLALEVSRVVGGLRADLERQVRSKRPVVTGDSVLSTQYSVLSDATP